MRPVVIVVVMLLAGCAAPAPPGDAEVGDPPEEVAPPENNGTPQPDAAEPPEEPSRGGDWPFATGDVAGTRVQRGEPTLEADDVADFVRLWNFTTAGAVTGTPTVKDGRLFVGTWKGVVHALDAATGEELWRRDGFAQIDATVSLWGDLVFVGDASARLTALAAGSGEEVWSVVVDETASAHLYATPLLLPKEDRAVLVQAVASDQESVRIHGDKPVDFRGKIVAYDAASGEELWRTVLLPEGRTGAPVWGTPIHDEVNDLLIFGTGNAYTEPADEATDAIVALHAENGSVAWIRQATPDDVFTQKNPESVDHDFGSTGTMFEGPDGARLFGLGQKSSVYWVLDPATGEVVEKVGRVKYGDEGVIGDSAYAEGVVIVPYATQLKIVAIDAATLEPRWNQTTAGPLFSDPVLISGAVLAADGRGNLHAWALEDGRELARFEVGDVYGGLSVVDGVLYVPSVGSGLLGERGGVEAWGLSP